VNRKEVRAPDLRDTGRTMDVGGRRARQIRRARAHQQGSCPAQDGQEAEGNPFRRDPQGVVGRGGAQGGHHGDQGHPEHSGPSAPHDTQDPGRARHGQ